MFDLFCGFIYLLIFQAVEWFYLSGPRFLGGWKGAPMEDICSAFLGIPALECVTELFRQVTLVSTLGFLTIYLAIPKQKN